MAVTRSSEVEWSRPDSLRWYSFDHKSVDVRDVLPIYCRIQGASSFKPHKPDGIEVTYLLDEKKRLEEKAKDLASQIAEAQAWNAAANDAVFFNYTRA